MHPILHFKTITRHKILVMKHCFRLGLYWRGLMHDMSKYSLAEFIPGAIYYRGFESPNNAERKKKGYTSAWLHHKGRNKHHFEYWIDYSSGEGAPVEGMRMPNKYIAEMFCDRLAASKVYKGDAYNQAAPWEYFNRSRRHYIIHPEVSRLIEGALIELRDNGEDAAFAWVKKNILGKA